MFWFRAVFEITRGIHSWSCQQSLRMDLLVTCSRRAATHCHDASDDSPMPVKKWDADADFGGHLWAHVQPVHSCMWHAGVWSHDESSWCILLPGPPLVRRNSMVRLAVSKSDAASHKWTSRLSRKWTPKSGGLHHASKFKSEVSSCVQYTVAAWVQRTQRHENTVKIC